MSSHRVICPSCGAVNRIPAEKEGVRGHCGACRGTLPPLYCHPQQLTGSNFDDFIAAYPGLVLVEFWAPWCTHCVSFAPAVRSVAEKLAGKAAVVQVSTVENPALASRFSVHGIPVIILLRQGKVVAQLPGVQSVEAVLTWFSQFSA